MDRAEPDWNQTLREQWEFHWNHHIRPRFEGLTDDEYFWSPARDFWSARPRCGPRSAPRSPTPSRPWRTWCRTSTAS